MVKVCSTCGIKEADNVKIVTVILPPTMPKRTNFCEPCLKVAVDNSILKNRAKHREENASF